MKPRISVRNTRISDDTKERIEKACAKLDRFFSRIRDCEVVLDKQKQSSHVEIIVKVPHQTIAASCSDENLYKAIDTARERLETQLKKYHDKMVAHR